MHDTPEDALLGVVRPVSYIEPEGEQDREPRPFETARGNAVQALALTRERLAHLRKQRDEINGEIKTLVEDEDLLDRMTRVRKTKKPG